MGPSISADVSAIADSAGALSAAIFDASARKARSYRTVQDARVAAAKKIATEKMAHQREKLEINPRQL